MVDDVPSVVGQTTVYAMAAALREMAPAVNSEEFRAVLELLAKSPMIWVTGVGKSGFVAMRMASTFASIGIRAAFVDPTELKHGGLGRLRRGDAFFVLSASGTTQELLDLQTKDMMEPAWVAITNPTSPLAEYSFICLPCAVPLEREGNPLGAPMVSCILQAAWGDALAAAYIKKYDVRPQDFRHHHPGGRFGGLR